MKSPKINLTEKEKIILDATHYGMDDYGCGWLHELKIQNLSEHQVAGIIGSLTQKGLVSCEEDDETDNCFWVHLTKDGWQAWRQLANTDEQSMDKYGCLIKTEGETIYTRPSDTDDWIEVTAPDTQEFLDFVHKHFGVWSHIKQFAGR